MPNEPDILHAAKEFADSAPAPLPSEQPGPATWRTVGWTIALTLLFLMALNAAAGWYLDEYGPNRGYWIVAQKWKLLDEVSGPVDTVILGDSSCNQGIDPVVWTAITGESALNLCTIGDMLTLDDAWLLERYIQRFGPPKRVIVSHVYDIWHRSWNPTLVGQVPASWGFWKDSLAPIELDWKTSLEVALSRYFPLYSQNASLKQVARKALSKPKSLLDRMVMTPSGFMPWERANPRGAAGDTAGHRRFVARNTFTMSPENKAGLDALAVLSEEHGFKLAYVPSPIHDQLAADTKWKAYTAELNGALNAWKARHPSVELHTKVHAFPGTSMENSDHLTNTAAQQFTRLVLTDLNVSAVRADGVWNADGKAKVLGQKATAFGPQNTGTEFTLPTGIAGGAFTIHLPVRLDKRPHSRVSVVSNWHDKANKRVFEVGINTFQVPYLGVSQSGKWDQGTRVFEADQSLRIGRDYLLTVVFEPAKRMAIFINGAPAGALTENVPEMLFVGDDKGVVGNRTVGNASFVFPGAIGSLEFVASSLSDQRIAQRAKASGTQPQSYAPLRRVTNPPGLHWFGYYDKFQFSADGRYLLTGRVGFENRKPGATDEVIVGMIDLQNDNAWTPIGTTRAWNWQQGSMLQWRPNSTEVLWNDRDDDHFVTRVYDTQTQTTRTLPRPIYHVSPDGEFAIGTDFARIQDMRAGYGYAGIPDPNHDEVAPESSSIYRMDLDSGQSKDLVRLSDVAAVKGSGRFNFDNSVHYFNHLQISPDGEKFLFLHRWIPKGRGFGTRFFTANVDGSNVQLLSEDRALSHYTWRDASSVLIWSGQRKGYALYELGKGYVSTVFEAENGHQSYVPGTENRWILTDTYPGKDRSQLLYLYDTKTDEIVVVASKLAPKKYTGEFRVDFHPRVSRDGKQVVIDGAFDDLGRQQYVFDISAIVGATP